MSELRAEEAAAAEGEFAMAAAEELKIVWRCCFRAAIATAFDAEAGPDNRANTSAAEAAVWSRGVTDAEERAE